MAKGPTQARGNVCDRICGRRPLAISDGTGLRILGGTNALPGMWPWVVSFQFLTRDGYRHFCAGSLINSRWVVSSAHCFYIQKYLKVEYWRVQIGATERSKPGPDAQTRSIKRLVDHEHFSRRLNLNDITLIELDKPVICNDYVQPACLPEQHLPMDTLTHCYVCGWGVTKITRERERERRDAYESGRPVYADILQEAKVHLISNDVCNSTRYYPGSVRTDHICALADEAKMDRCEGDGGGPLMCRLERSERYWVIGITSWGRGCTLGKWPGVFTSTHYFYHWIVKTLRDPPQSALVPPFIPTPPPPPPTTTKFKPFWVVYHNEFGGRFTYLVTAPPPNVTRDPTAWVTFTRYRSTRRSTWAPTGTFTWTTRKIKKRRPHVPGTISGDVPEGAWFTRPTQKTTRKANTWRPKWLIEHYQHAKTWPSYWPTPQP
uniref:Acrosin-like n=1 Tax=Pogona vitticeps TaxID=103695 RepID=A0ABM5GK73_9SAUR